MNATARSMLADLWLELADGERRSLFAQTDDERAPRPVALELVASGPVWRAVLWADGPAESRQADAPAERLGVLVATWPSRGEGGGPFRLQAERPASGPPIFSAGATDGAPLQIVLHRGQRGRLEERRMRRQATIRRAGHDPAAIQGKACLRETCRRSVVAQCGQCRRAFCQDDGHVAPGQVARCTVCLDATLGQVVAVAVRSDRLETAEKVLESWADGESAPPAGRRLLGLVRAQQGDYDGALGLLAPLAEHTAGPQSLAVPLAHAHLGRAAQAAERDAFVAAAVDVAAALRYAPDLTEARRVLPLLKDWQVLACIQDGRLTEAIELWDQDLRRRPTDLTIIHRLAILYYRSATVIGVGSGPGGRAQDARTGAAHWRIALAYWACVLHSTAFWAAWRTRRGDDASQGVGDEVIVDVRRAHEEQLLQDLRDLVAAAREASGTAAAQPFEELELLWGLEMRTAATMTECAQTGGLSRWPTGFACGPLMLEQLSRTEEGRPLVAAVRGAASTLRHPAGVRLERYLSPLGRAHFLLGENRLDRAIAELEPLATRPEARVLLASALCSKASDHAEVKRWDDALATYERAGKLGANLGPWVGSVVDASIKAARRVTDDDRPDYDAAIRILERGHALTPGQKELRSNLGATYAQRARVANNAHRYEDAATYIRAALGYAPDDAQSLHFARITFGNLAASIIDKEPDRAIELLKESLSYESDTETTQILSGLCFSHALKIAQSGNLPRAIALMQDELRFDPEVTTPPTESAGRHRLHVALHNLGMEAANDERWDDAIRIFLLALNVENATDTRQMVAQSYALRAIHKSEKLGDPAGALLDLQAAARMDPTNPTYQRFLT